MDYIQKLKNAAEENSSIVCMGMDPVIEKIPLKGEPGEVILKFFSDILEAIKSEDVRPGIVKPNIAFFEQYGDGALNALSKIRKMYHDEGFMVLLDAKRGDIGTTSGAYAKSIFGLHDFDAVTVAPYMGSDSVGPFIEWCEKGKGVYILNRTSNKGARDIQDLQVDGKPLYWKVSGKILEWHKPGTGAVVGATYPQELKEISEYFVKSGKQVPLLIPGVGSQGGSAAEVVDILRKTGNPLWLHRINSSSGILYAYQKQGTDDFAGAAVKEIKKLNKEIGDIK